MLSTVHSTDEQLCPAPVTPASRRWKLTIGYLQFDFLFIYWYFLLSRLHKSATPSLRVKLLWFTERVRTGENRVLNVRYGQNLSIVSHDTPWFTSVHCAFWVLDFTGSHRSVFKFVLHLLSYVSSCLTGVIFMSDKTVPDLNDMGGHIPRVIQRVLLIHLLWYHGI